MPEVEHRNYIFVFLGQFSRILFWNEVFELSLELYPWQCHGIPSLYVCHFFRLFSLFIPSSVYSVSAQQYLAALWTSQLNLNFIVLLFRLYSQWLNNSSLLFGF